MEFNDQALSPEQQQQVALLRVQAHVEQLLAAGTRLRQYTEQLKRDAEQMKAVAEQVYLAARQAADEAEQNKAEQQDDEPPLRERTV
jgi:sulfur transfer protein SufE